MRTEVEPPRVPDRLGDGRAPRSRSPGARRARNRGRRTTTSPTARAASAPTARPSSAAPSTTGSTRARRAASPAAGGAPTTPASATAPGTTSTAWRTAAAPISATGSAPAAPSAAAAAAATPGGSTATTSATGSATRRSASRGPDRVPGRHVHAAVRRRVAWRAAPRPRSTTRTAEHAPAHGCAPPTAAVSSRAVLPSAGAVVAPDAGKLAMFGRLADATMALHEFDGAGWSTTASRTALVRLGHRGDHVRLRHLRVRHGATTSGFWWNRRPNGGAWATAWQDIGGNCVSDPAIGGRRERRLRVRPWWRRRESGTRAIPAGGFGALACCSAATSTPIRCAVSDPTGVYVFVAASDQAIWYRRFVGGSPGPWMSLGGHARPPIRSRVGTASGSDRRRPAVPTTRSGSGTSSGTTASARGSGSAASPPPTPPLCSGPCGHVRVRARHRQRALVQQVQRGLVVDAVRRLGANSLSSPIAISDTAGVSVLFIGSDNALRTFRFANGSWGPEQFIRRWAYAPVRGRQLSAVPRRVVRRVRGRGAARWPSRRRPCRPARPMPTAAGAPQGNVVPALAAGLRRRSGRHLRAGRRPGRGADPERRHEAGARRPRHRDCDHAPTAARSCAPRSAKAFPQVLAPGELALASVKFRRNDVRPDAHDRRRRCEHAGARRRAARALAVGDLVLSRAADGLGRADAATRRSRTPPRTGPPGAPGRGDVLRRGAATVDDHDGPVTTAAARSPGSRRRSRCR